MVEFALLSPLLFLLIMGTVDFGRLIYTYSAISSAAREGARLLSLRPQATSDCLALQRMLAVGQGFPLSVDPHSVAGNSDPNDPNGGPPSPSVPPAGSGLIYIYPAVSRYVSAASPQYPNNCDATSARGQQRVTVMITYHFAPLTPLIANMINNFQIKTISVVTEEGAPAP
jgi:hypothetical protein